jgi:hypothetical protein
VPGELWLMVLIAHRSVRTLNDSLIVRHRSHAVTIEPAIVIPDPVRDFSNFYHGLAFDGKSFGFL